MTSQDLIIGNSLEVLRTIQENTVDVCVTSPPYWGLRDYDSEPAVYGGDPQCDHQWEGDRCTLCNAWKGQLGLEPSPYEYIQHLCNIFDQVKRVLKPTGACWVDIGDTYNGSKAGNTDVYKNDKASTDTFFKPEVKGIGKKSLLQIPSRFAIEMTDRGWILRNECIWHKPNVMPQSMKDRFTVDFEKFFFFTKEPNYYFDQVKETSRLPDMRSRMEGGRNARTVWSINTKPSQEDHCAMFPTELIDRPIQACCPKGGTVLDPFCGSGTTLEYCRKHDLNCIGIEINPRFKEIIERRAMKNIGKLEDYIMEEHKENTERTQEASE